MFERFTDAARQVVVLAQSEARLLNHNYIGTEHLLLGILSHGEGVAAKALASMDVDLDGVRRRVEEVIGRGQEPPTGQIPFTPRAKKVMELSLREAMQLGHQHIGTEHVLLGLMREGEGVAAQVLRQFGADADRVRQVVLTAPGLGAAEPAVQRPPTGPQCPVCGTALEGGVRSTVTEARDDDRTLPVVLLWCEACGRTLGALPAPPPP